MSWSVGEKLGSLISSILSRKLGTEEKGALVIISRTVWQTVCSDVLFGRVDEKEFIGTEVALLNARV